MTNEVGDTSILSFKKFWNIHVIQKIVIPD